MDATQIARQYPILTLAYIGDAVYELYVRRYLVEKDAAMPQSLHRAAKQYVSAQAQSQFVDRIMEHLTEQEQAIYRRGRNAKSHSHPKNADLGQYHRATGFEALWGYLYLAGEQQRLDTLFSLILETNK